MKQETKELIIWIKKQINLAKDCCIDSAWKGRHEQYNADYEKAMNFLDSLPEIESHLKNGGSIPDRNRTPCCDGDEVKFTLYPVWGDDNTKITGKLSWSTTLKKFIFVSDKYGTGYDFEDVYEFEKITKEED